MDFLILFFCFTLIVMPLEVFVKVLFVRACSAWSYKNFAIDMNSIFWLFFFSFLFGIWEFDVENGFIFLLKCIFYIPCITFCNLFRVCLIQFHSIPENYNWASKIINWRNDEIHHNSWIKWKFNLIRIIIISVFIYPISNILFIIVIIK